MKNQHTFADMSQEITSLNLKKLVLRTFAVIFFLTIVSAAAFATTYYSRNNTNWTVNATWSTAGFGGSPASSTPGVNDTAKIGDGYSVTLNSSVTCAQLDIGQGTSGALQFSGAGIYTLTISGNLTIMTGGLLQYNSNSTKTHSLQVGGNITNDGTLDLYYDADDIVNLTLNTSSPTTISGSGNWELNNVTINKAAASDVVEVQASGFEAAINTLAGTSGTYIHNNAGSYSVNSSSATDFAINQNMIFKVPQGSMTFSPNSTRTYLYGALYVNGGNVYIGSTTGTNGLRYDQVGAGIPYLEVSSGTLTVYGGINFASGAGSDPFSFRMTGGTLLLNSGSIGSSIELFLINDVASSVFYMSGGTITIQNHNSSPGNNSADWSLCGGSGAVTSTGGTVQFGNGLTPSGTTFDFVPYSNVIQPNFKITGLSSASIGLQPSKSSTADLKLLSLYIDSNKTFDIRSILGVSGSSRTVTLTSTYNGSFAFYNHGTFESRTGAVVFAGSASQNIGGNAQSTFYNLIINNIFGVSLNNAEFVSNLLTMSSGRLYTTTSAILTCTSTANANMGSANSYVSGPMIHTIATTAPTTKNYPIGRSGSYRPAILSVTHSTSASVKYKGEMFNTPAKSLNYALPSTVNSVSNTRYWNFVRDTVSNLSSATVTLYYNLDDTVTNKNRVVIVHDDGSSNWVDYGGTGTADSIGSITSTNITSFKTKFSFGFPPSPLPVKLIRFAAKKLNESVRCEWETASEINNDYFTLERSWNGVEYVPLGKIKGAGNSTTVHIYQYEDVFPIEGHSYYRLRQTDYNGEAQYSEAVHVFFQDRKEAFTFFPNPSPGQVNITREGESMEGTRAVVQDMNGKQVQASQYVSNSKDQLIVDIGAADASRNEFFVLYLFTPTGIIKEKILVGNK